MASGSKQFFEGKEMLSLAFFAKTFLNHQFTFMLESAHEWFSKNV
jgi:hypothetical protein